MNKRIIHCIAAAGAAIVAAAPMSSLAADDGFVANGGAITATFEGLSAAYTSMIRLASADFTSGWVLPNQSTAVGTTFNFGSLAAGAHFGFDLLVSDTSDTWHTGAASGNSDGVVHANAVENWNGTGRTYVAFEDQRGGGDRDFNDYTFSFTNAPMVNAVPEPENYVMLLAGLGMIGWIARRRKKTERRVSTPEGL